MFAWAGVAVAEPLPLLAKPAPAVTTKPSHSCLPNVCDEGGQHVDTTQISVSAIGATKKDGRFRRAALGLSSDYACRTDVEEQERHAPARLFEASLESVA